MLSKIKDYGVSLTKAGLAQVVVQFESEEDGKVYTWRGSFKGGAREFTLKALMKMGFDSDNLEPLANGFQGGALNHLQEYDIQLETKTNEEGKSYTVVSWINLPGESAIRGKLEKNDALAALKQLGSVKGDILAIKKSLPAAPKKQKEAVDEDVPF